jgi:hypothetical protein
VSYVWTTRAGERVPLDQMSGSHLVNLFAWLDKRCERWRSEEFMGWLKHQVHAQWLVRVADEIARRQGARPKIHPADLCAARMADDEDWDVFDGDL